MDSTESQFVHLSQQIATAALQAVVEYNEAQANLDLKGIITPQRLASASGTAASRKTIVALAELTAQHKRMFSTFMATTTREILAVTNLLAPEQRSEVTSRLASSMNWNLAAQATLYEGREKWIDAATKLLDLVDRHRAAIEFRGDTLAFFSDEPFEEFNALVKAMDAVHEAEVSALAERKARIAAAAARLKLEP